VQEQKIEGLADQWNFGDSESDIGEVVEHTFLTTGEYTVILTVKYEVESARNHQPCLNTVSLHQGSNNNCNNFLFW
jgi:PKD repeat protein